MKGVLACLLSLALVVTCFGNIGAKAATDKGTAKTTFTVTINSVAYTYEVAKNQDATADVKVSLADITKNAKAANKSIDDNYADGIIVTDVKKGSAAIGADDAAIAYNTTTNEFTIKKQAETDDGVTIADVAIAITAVPKKINYVFTINYGNPTVEYTAKFPVDNLNVTTKKVSFTAAEIIAAAVNGEGENAKSLAAENVVLTKINNVDVNSAEYKFEQDYTAEYKSEDVAIGNNVATAAIEGITYDPSKDSVVIETAVKDVTISYALVKAASGNKVSKFANVKTGDDKMATIALNNKKAGVSVAENKDTYLCVLVGAVKPEKGQTFDANVTVKATSYKKLAVNFNYAKADKGVNVLAIASVVVTPASGEAKTYTTDSEEWATITGSLQYSVDNGKTWLKVNGSADQEVLVGYNYALDDTAAEVVESVTIKDISKLAAGAYTFADNKWTYTPSPAEYTYSGATTVDNGEVTIAADYSSDSENVVYKYSDEVAEVKDETTGEVTTAHRDAGWYLMNGDNMTTTVMPDEITLTKGTAAAGKTITITKTQVKYNLVSGAEVKLKSGENITAAGTITLTEVKDNGKLTGEKLYGWTLEKKAPKIQFRLTGASATDTEVAYRNTKAAKASVKKAAKAPKVKVDGVKGTIAIKNGYDYAVLTEEGATPEPSDWITILPFNKESKNETYTIATSDFVPTKKFAETSAAYFTSKKIKSISIADLFTAAKGTSENVPNSIYVFVRKSAADGKPASAASTAVKIDKATAAPALKSLKDAEGKYAEAVKSDKGTAFTIPTISNDATDKNTASYEYLIIKAEDLGKVDYAASKWGKLVAGKTLTVDKTKSKYVVGTESKDATLGTDCLILIRRAGDKKKGVLPSEVLVTKVTAVKITVDKEQVDGYAWEINS